MASSLIGKIPITRIIPGTSAGQVLLVNPNADSLAWGGLLGLASGATPGSILISGAAGVLAENNANLFWDNTNNFLGIGTAAPGQRLDIQHGHFRFTQHAAPGAATGALAGLGAGLLTAGDYKYKVTIVTAAGETQAGTVSNTVTVVNAAVNGQISLTGIPTGTSGVATSRKIYRTVANGATYLLLATIANNTATTYTDNIADAALGAAAPTNNSTAGGFYLGATKLAQSNQSGALDFLVDPTIGSQYVYRVGGTDVSLADGGTNASLTASIGGIFYSTATAGAILSGTATASQILLSGSSAAPTWSTATYPAATTINQLLYSSANNVIAGLASNNNGVLVTSAGGVPSISTNIPTAVTIGSAYVYRAGGTVVAVADGGTGVNSWTDGQLLIGKTAGNTAVLGTLTGTANRISVTNGASSITLSAPQDIATSSTPQFARLGLGVAAHATNVFSLLSADTTASGRALDVSHTGGVAGTGYAGYFSKTGASTTNVGLYAEASGATNNYAAIFSGNVGIGIFTPSNKLYVSDNSSGFAVVVDQLNINGHGLNINVASTANTKGVMQLTSNSGSNQLLYVRADGNIGIGTTTPSSPLSIGLINGQQLRFDSATELTTIAAAASTNTAIQIPVNAVVLAVSVRVTTVIPTAATFTVTGTTSATIFNTAAVSTAANSTDLGTAACPYKNGAAQTITITPNLTPAAGTGQVRVTIHYYTVTPATS